MAIKVVDAPNSRLLQQRRDDVVFEVGEKPVA